MKVTVFLGTMVLAIAADLVAGGGHEAQAGQPSPSSDYRVLAPVRHGNLTVFPVVAARSYDTEEFLTLDEGLRSGEVIVTESGSLQPLMRRRRTPIPPGGAQVNQLVVVNNS